MEKKTEKGGPAKKSRKKTAKACKGSQQKLMENKSWKEPLR